MAALCRCRRVVAALLTSQLASLLLHFGAARELLLFLPNYMAAICSTRIAADVVSYTPLPPSPPAAPVEQRPRQRQRRRRRLPMSVSGFYLTLCSCCLCFVVALLLLLLFAVHLFCYSANCLLYFAITELVLSYLISQLIGLTNKELNYLLYTRCYQSRLSDSTLSLARSTSRFPGRAQDIA